MTKSLRVVCFDDNRNFRDSMQLLMGTTKNLILAGAFASYEDMLESIKSLTPDVVLMDIDIPPVSGIEAVKTLRGEFPDLPVLMLTGFEDDEKVFSSLCAGANGYILKSVKMDSLILHIEEVYHGGAPMTPVIARKVLNQFAKVQPANTSNETYQLTDREREVLQLLVQGKSYKMIAGELNISYETVHSRIRKIYQKLQVNSLGEAVSKTITQRILK
jgi:DNA-binding NarL/FixJ family response regulator